MSKKAWIAVILLALIGGVVIAQAVRTFLSPEIDVTIEEAVLTLTVDATTRIIGDTLNFSGTFTTPTYFIADQNITLWCDGIYTGYSNLTDEEGYYEIFYPAETVGLFSFYTNATITGS